MTYRRGRHGKSRSESPSLQQQQPPPPSQSNVKQRYRRSYPQKTRVAIPINFGLPQQRREQLSPWYQYIRFSLSSARVDIDTFHNIVTTRSRLEMSHHTAPGSSFNPHPIPPTSTRSLLIGRSSFFFPRGRKRGSY